MNLIFITSLHSPMGQNSIISRLLLWRFFSINQDFFKMTLLVHLDSQENTSWRFYFDATFISLIQPSAPIRIFHHQEYEEHALKASCLDLTALMESSTRELWRIYLVWAELVYLHIYAHGQYYFICIFMYIQIHTYSHIIIYAYIHASNISAQRSNCSTL